MLECVPAHSDCQTQFPGDLSRRLIYQSWGSPFSHSVYKLIRDLFSCKFLYSLFCTDGEEVSRQFIVPYLRDQPIWWEGGVVRLFDTYWPWLAATRELFFFLKIETIYTNLAFLGLSCQFCAGFSLWHDKPFYYVWPWYFAMFLTQEIPKVLERSVFRCSSQWTRDSCYSKVGEFSARSTLDVFSITSKGF